MTRLLLADVMPLEDPAVYSSLYANASGTRKAAADFFRFQKDRMLSVGAAALLDCGLLRYGLREGEMSYGTTACGKPYFITAPEIHFSISHSASMVAVALSDFEVGCDIEQITSVDMELARRFFANEEYLSVAAEPDEAARIQAFFRLWTLKESYMKAVGKGMSLPPDSFCIAPVPGGYAVSSGCGTDTDFHLMAHEPCSGYAAALCFKSATAYYSIEHLDLKHIS